MLSKILTKFCSRTGFSSSSQRATALYYINEAAEEIYDASDLPGTIEEMIAPITKDARIALPSYVGQIRGIRTYEWRIKQKIETLVPSYCANPWASEIDTWKYVGTSAIKTALSNTGILQLRIPQVESTPAVVTVSGGNNNSRHISDSVTLSALLNLTTSHFSSIESITKDINTTYNIQITDVDGNEIAILDNNKFKTEYKVFIISPYVSTDTYVEICYKKIFRELIDDGDEFICAGFDDAILYKALSIFESNKPGNEQRAIMADQKSQQRISDKVKDITAGTTSKIRFSAPRAFKGVYSWNTDGSSLLT